jgi:hypothetical protein
MTKYGQPQKGGGGAGRLLAPVLAIALLGGIGYFGYHYWRGLDERATDAETGCLTNAPTPHSILFMVDATDRISPQHSERIRSKIMETVASLPRYSRVIVVDFSEDTAAPLLPRFNRCLPGRAGNAEWDQGAQLLEKEYQQFEASLKSMIAGLQQLPDSKSSPITEQIIRAASDPQLHWQGRTRTLVLVTDGLESSIYWTRWLQLADPPEGLLRDARVEYFEIGNAKGSRLQTRDMRLEWKSWLERAGADVRITAPGFAAYDP